jgi:pyochelin synthetase
LLPNGKIDRGRLPAPDLSRSSGIGQVGPRDSIEVKLALLWQEILGVEAPGVFDDFFDVGGDSLQAARFAARVADLFGRRIELAAMAENATIDVIARQVRRDADDGAWSPLVAMRSTGTRPPLFVVHPAGGTILPYVDLSRSLSIEQPFFGIQAYGYEPDQTPDTNVEAMAARYVDALLAEFPEGPYRLAGWSFGAVVALEMAQQLRRAGREVDRLVIIDAALGLEQPHQSEDDIIQRLIGLYSQLVTQGATVVENELSDLAPAARTRLLIERAVEARLFPADFNVEQARRLARIVASCFEAGKAYVPRPYGGRLTLIRASRMPVTVLDEALGWSEVAAGRFELIWTAGDHLSMMRRPDVAVLAERIWAVLENQPLIAFRSPVPAAS